MITKNKIKQIKSLTRKKNREEMQSFVVEGYKSIRELKNAGLSVEEIYVTKEANKLHDLNPEIISIAEMKSISNLKTPPGYLAIVKMLKTQEIPERGLILALDNIQDPGNLGTIVRLADWFNVEHIVCNSNTVDLYNPKCIQATMGSIARVQLHYVELETFLKDTQLPIFVTAMSEQSIYEKKMPTDGILVMGSESHGISTEIMQLGTKISIPQYSSDGIKTESLNVATATGIVLAEWRRFTGM
ncbi:RNA methyltransferase, TrmH family [Nonlabens sp. Hel1_33_55]|uniref:TrmH family RNA methyltransferase n=1 Tax=Nonlabens sp. Hel1_33_55 TaxID=1336802 RepID=UPI000875EDD0|nr:RNA methyltransferase [Nonlabens sp. Hel1_33_55]SCY26224.1 RNA methyltransferase, TrmH family [Nonlabens sp. Hel1_33_55]